MKSSFRYDVIKGQTAKEIVKGLLTDSDYKVFSFGYESLMSQFHEDFRNPKVEQTDSVRRIRSMPDLIVYDNAAFKPFFTEVKYRNANDVTRVTLDTKSIERYQEYWNDSVLVVVVPKEHAFYAQYVSKLRKVHAKNGNDISIFDLTTEFQTIEDIFDKVSSQIRLDYHSLLLQFENMNGGSSSAYMEARHEYVMRKLRARQKS